MSSASCVVCELFLVRGDSFCFSYVLWVGTGSILLVKKGFARPPFGTGLLVTIVAAAAYCRMCF